MRIERRKRLQAERLRKEEEERLKKKMKQEEARREAERLHLVGRGGGGRGRGRECGRGGWRRSERKGEGERGGGKGLEGGSIPVEIVHAVCNLWWEGGRVGGWDCYCHE